MPVHLQRPGIRLVHAGQDLHQRRLARAVLADQGVRLPGVQLDRPVGQRLHRAERLGRVPQHQHGRFGGIARLVRGIAHLVRSA
jgi:hypothetical protein